MLETYVRPFPLSTRSGKNATLAGVETAPQDLIADITVNDVARDLLPNSFKYLASADYFRAHIRISVPNETSASYVLVPKTSGRVVPISHGVVPFGNERMGWRLGRIITAKGSWATGESARIQVNNGESMYTHIGLLSVEGAQGDMSVSNTLLSHGFRSALHLGFVVFKDTSLQSWLASRWTKDSHHTLLWRSFQQVKKSGGAAYLFRLGGALERIDNQDYLIHGSDRMRVETMQSSRLLAEESRLKNSALSPALSIIEQADRAIEALTTIGNGHLLNPTQYHSYADFLCALVAQNASALNQISTSRAAVILGDKIGMQKDTDLAWYGYDYDAATPEGVVLTSSHQDNTAAYISQALNSLETILFDIVAPHFFCPAGYDYGVMSQVAIPRLSDRVSKFVASLG